MQLLRLLPPPVVAFAVAVVADAVAPRTRRKRTLAAAMVYSSFGQPPMQGGRWLPSRGPPGRSVHTAR